MAQAKKRTRIPSTPLKRGVKSTMQLANKAIADGNKAVQESSVRLRKDGSARNRASLARNRRTLAKAKTLLASLKQAEKLANSMCPLQVLFIEFAYD